MTTMFHKEAEFEERRKASVSSGPSSRLEQMIEENTSEEDIFRLPLQQSEAYIPRERDKDRRRGFIRTTEVLASR
jgi:hypothetical protein